MSTFPVGESEFLAHSKNYAELREKLNKLGLRSDLSLLDDYARHVTGCWFKLAEQHLAECVESLAIASLERTVYSRAYYAAYNASKAVRYMTKGIVSLRGDDHKAAPDLPSDFVDAAKWGASITILYEHRLRADYDNWKETSAAHTLTTNDAVDQAKAFVDAARKHLTTKHGLKL